MEQKIFDFIGWVNYRYGRVGSLVALLLTIAILALAFLLLNKLPESKTEIIWSKCSSCKYKCKNRKVFVLECPEYEEPKWGQFKSPLCPISEKFDSCIVIYNISNPSLFLKNERE